MTVSQREPITDLGELRLICTVLTGMAVLSGIVLTVLAIVIGPVLKGSNGSATQTIMLICTAIPVAVAATLFVVRSVITKNVTAKAVRAVLSASDPSKTDTRLTVLYAELTFIRFGMLEGAAVLAGIAMLMVGQFGLVALITIHAAAMLLNLPSEERRGVFIDRVIERAKQTLPAA